MIGWSRHCVCFFIDPVGYRWLVATQLFKQFYDLRGLLIIQDRQFEQ